MEGKEESIKNDNSNKIKVIKRPVSLTLIILLGVAFLLALLLTIFLPEKFSVSSLMKPFLFFMPIILFISLMLIDINRKKNQKRTKSFIISSAVSFVLLILAIVFFITFENHLETGNLRFDKKQYEAAIGQYNLVIEQNKDLQKVELAKSKIIEAQYFIDQTKNLTDSGDSYFKNNLFDKAIVEYNKAKEIYPYLKGLDTKILDTNSKIKVTA